MAHGSCESRAYRFSLQFQQYEVKADKEFWSSGYVRQNTRCRRSPKDAARSSALCYYLSILDAAWEITCRVLRSPEGARAWAAISTLTATTC